MGTSHGITDQSHRQDHAPARIGRCFFDPCELHDRQCRKPGRSQARRHLVAGRRNRRPRDEEEETNFRRRTEKAAHEPTVQKAANYTAVGVASWYGADFHGRRTANGETFDMNSFSAAHPSLPLPSNVRITNLDNQRSVVVRVNDRGPFVGGRVIDVSAKTAKVLGFYDDGLSKVKVEYVGRAQ